MTNFRFKGEVLFADGVDVKRLARNIKNAFNSTTLPSPMTLEAALELVSQGLNSSNYHEIRRRASAQPKGQTVPEIFTGELDVRDWDIERIAEFVREKAICHGQAFPDGLPSRFDSSWQKQAMLLLSAAVGELNPGRLEFVALVGRSGSGKTLLAKNYCALRGGLVVDVSLTDQDARSLMKANEPVLVYDRSPVDSPSNLPLNEFWNGLATDKRTLCTYRAHARRPSSDIPHDQDRHGLRKWHRTHGAVPELIICFDSTDDLENALNNAYVDPLVHLSGNWYRSHVVNLDDMTYRILLSPDSQVWPFTDKPVGARRQATWF